MKDLLNDKPKDECGVFGIYSNSTNDLASTIYYGLYALQHRGQESAGIAITTGNEIEYYKGKGLVHQVFTDKHLNRLPEGDIGIGHVLYASDPNISVVDTQPVVFNGRAGKFAIAMNGKITNAEYLRNKLIKDGVVFQSKIDVEVIANLINKYYDKDNAKESIKQAVSFLEGSFALLIMSSNSLYAVRDRFAMRPLCIGKYCDDYFLSSESCALDATEATFIRDIKAGEIVEINSSGVSSIFMDNIVVRPCIFEFVYTARADSIIDGTSVYEARFKCGQKLAQSVKIDADLVAGVPDSAIVAARGYASESGLPYVDVLEKNRYVGRTFIQPSQIARENSVRIKLNGHRANIQGKRIILVDDSLVRGTTSKKIVELLKRLGAKEVHLVLASPRVLHPCYTGIDIESYDQLLAANNSIQEMCDMLGCDSLHFLKIEDLRECCSSKQNNTFCAACFDKKYYGIKL